MEWGVIIQSSLIILRFNFSEFYFTNSVENPIGVDGKDNDENGFPDDFAGWDFFDDDNVPFDENGHGTLVASIIAAESNNNIGIAGISPTAHILPIRVLDDFGRGEIPNLGVSDLVLAIDYALRRNAKIINISFGGIGFSQTEELVFEFTDKAGVLMVIAAGNGQFVGDGSGDDNDISPTYPASYLSSNIISVAAVDRSGQLSFFSNYGLNSVDIAAPGTDILGSDITREVIFFEDFEIGAPDWTSGQGFLNASPFTWAIVNFSDNSFLDDGSGANAYVNNTETFAISPVIDLTGSLGPQLSFKADYAIARVFSIFIRFCCIRSIKKWSNMGTL